MFRTPLIFLMLWTQMVKVESTCDTELQNGLFQDLLNMMLKIKGPSSEPSTCNCKKIVIAFTASLSATKSIGSGAVVKFDKVWTNEGKGYDPNSGIFTAPRKGFYQISATTMSPNGKYFYSYLMKNNEKNVGVYTGKGFHTGSANIVLKLKKGDRVYIKHRSNTEEIYSDSDHWSMFSGFLISE
ncbi:complement C1q subcomponent subunit A-like isoform X2 [Mytilus californianus]|uniref:complement C1q subcomponent subunit A-like isoform X2 n=1 Tax=Mytilus californianus TaxID=6549 RepID=UPI0022472C22|nr:complement C1q subcomponent subunit A-like isoform X2 [Mytilus californianus]